MNRPRASSHPAWAVLIILAAPRSTPALEAYRCLANGQISFSQTAEGPDCEAIEVNTYTPPPEEVARSREELAEWRRNWERAEQERLETRQLEQQKAREEARKPPASPAQQPPRLPFIPPEVLMDREDLTEGY